MNNNYDSHKALQPMYLGQALIFFFRENKDVPWVGDKFYEIMDKSSLPCDQRQSYLLQCLVYSGVLKEIQKDYQNSKSSDNCRLVELFNILSSYSFVDKEQALDLIVLCMESAGVKLNNVSVVDILNKEANLSQNINQNSKSISANNENTNTKTKNKTNRIINKSNKKSRLKIVRNILFIIVSVLLLFDLEVFVFHKNYPTSVDNNILKNVDGDSASKSKLHLGLPRLLKEDENEGFFKSLSSTSTSTSSTLAFNQSSKISSIGSCQPGEFVVFGSYQQSSLKEPKTNPILWRVLERKGNIVLLLSEYGIESLPYHNKIAWLTWNDADLRSWLNNDFFNKAFTSQEKEMILLTDLKNSDAYFPWHISPGGGESIDKVFLLSVEETYTFLPQEGDKILFPTNYAREKGAYVSPKGDGWWWLRSPGGTSEDASGVNYNGTVISDRVNKPGALVRPALRIKTNI